MWKIGQKLVCVRDGKWTPGSPPESWVTNGEIYEYDGVAPYSLRGFILVKEVIHIGRHGFRVSFNPTLFRPVDETFGESVAEKLEKEFISQPEPALV